MASSLDWTAPAGNTQDLKGIWRPFGPGGAHEVSFGVHHDRYTLNNPTYNTPNWITSSDSGNGTLFTYGKGTTETTALWLQDAWNITPRVRLTLGARGEQWKAYDGFNFAGTLGVFQPPQQSTNFSPKASVFWQFDPDLELQGLVRPGYPLSDGDRALPDRFDRLGFRRAQSQSSAGIPALVRIRHRTPDEEQPVARLASSRTTPRMPSSQQTNLINNTFRQRPFRMSG